MRRLSVAYDGPARPASSSTRRLSALLTGSMIRASTSCLKTSSPPLAGPKPSTSKARDRASSRQPIRDAVIGSGPPGAAESRPRSSSPCPAASRCRATAFSNSSSTSSCAEPMCSIFPRPAARGVHNLHRDGARRRLHRPHLRHPAALRPTISAQIQLSRTQNKQVTASRHSKTSYREPTQVMVRITITRAGPDASG